MTQEKKIEIHTFMRKVGATDNPSYVVPIGKPELKESGIDTKKIVSVKIIQVVQDVRDSN